MTFTPMAILRSPFEIYDLIVKLDKHPLWTCYIHPLVVAAVARLAYGDHDPVRMLEKYVPCHVVSAVANISSHSGEFFFERLLRLIDEGKLALLRAPPTGPAAVKQPHKADPTTEWQQWVLSLPCSSQREIMEKCTQLLETRFSKVSDKNLPHEILAEVLYDLRQMQLQPTIMDNYRRFVVMTEGRNDLLEADGVSRGILLRILSLIEDAVDRIRGPLQFLVQG